MLKRTLVVLALLAPFSAFAQAPPTDLELMQARAESAEAQAKYFALAIQKLQGMNEALKEYWHKWCLGEQTCE